MSKSSTIQRPLSVREVMILARSARGLVNQAIVTGALPVLVENPKAKGRTPRWLISHDAAMAWIAAGRPTASESLRRPAKG